MLQRAWDAGVDKIIVTGGNLEGSREALALARTDPRLFCTVGVHPTRCSEFEDSGDPEAHLGKLLELAREGAAEGKVVAVGECGLDYDRLQFCPADVQKKYFAMQFRVAEATRLPMFLHMRAAAEDFLAIVKEHEASLVSGGVVHSFTGSASERDAILADPKLCIGVNGCSLKTQENLEVYRSCHSLPPSLPPSDGPLPPTLLSPKHPCCPLVPWPLPFPPAALPFVSWPPFLLSSSCVLPALLCPMWSIGSSVQYCHRPQCAALSSMYCAVHCAAGECSALMTEQYCTVMAVQYYNDNSTVLQVLQVDLQCSCICALLCRWSRAYLRNA